MPQPSRNTEDLIQNCLEHRGDSQEQHHLNKLLNAYQEQVARWCLQLLGNPDDAADCAQETLVRLCRGLNGFRGECHFNTWVYSITRATCLNAVRKRQVRQERESDFQAKKAPIVPAPEPLSVLESQETRKLFYALFTDSLTKKEAQVMVLHHVDGLTLDAIDEQLHLANLSGAKAFLVNAKRKLRSRLSTLRLRKVGFDVPSPQRTAVRSELESAV